MNTLTNREKDTLAYTGVFGALISATCLIQLFVITREHWISYALIGVYSFSIISFSLLAMLRAIAPWLLIACAGFLFIAQLVFITQGVFSLIILLSFLYSVIIIIVVFIERMPQKLRAKALAERAEEMAWRNKL